MRTLHVLVAFAAGTCAFAACADRLDSVLIIVHDDAAEPAFGVIEVSAPDPLHDAPAGPADWERILAVFTGQDPVPGDPALLGAWSTADGRVRFTPRFPPVPGQAYTVRVAAGALGWPGYAHDAVVDTVFRIARYDREPDTRVAETFPSVDTVPENLLRLYVRFASPMSIGEAERRIRLLDADGSVVEDAFLVVPQELWDPDRTRLTVLFDPGRIKRDLRPSDELGLPLRAGRIYTLVIDSAWRDGRGVALAAGYRRSFTVGAADRVYPRPDEWRLEIPGAATRDPLVVRFPEPMDHGLLGRTLTVLHAGRPVAGSVRIGAGERSWVFRPGSPWTAGDHALRIDTDLEDLAGNNLRQVFDIDPAAPDQRSGLGDAVDRPFVVR